MIFMFRTRTWVPGCLGGRSRGAWAASPGLLGRLPGAPQGGSRPQTTRPNPVYRPFEFASKFMSMFMSIFGHSGLDLGSLWGSFSVMLAPFSAQVGLGTDFEPTYLRKIDFQRNITFSNGFCSKLTPRWGQERPKIAPRPVQDRRRSPFFSS